MIDYRDGSFGAFEILYERHSSKIFGFVRSRLGNQSNVEDVFQNVFTKLHKYRHKYNPSYPFLPWLFTICRNVIIDTLRHQGKSPEVLQDQFDHYADSKAETTEATSSSETLQEIEKLPDRQRRAINMRYSQDFSFEQIAKELNSAPQNARQLVSRGVRNLKLLLRSEKGSK